MKQKNKQNRPFKMLMLGCTTALVAGTLIISQPAYSQEEAVEKPGMAISVRNASTLPLSIFIRRVWQDSPIMQEAEVKVKMAGAQKKAASKWMYNPEVEFGFEDKDGATESKTVGISQTIDWSGKFLASGKVAKFELQAAAAERDQIRQSLAVDVLSALSDYQAAGEILELSSRRTALMNSFASLAKKGFKAGDIEQSEYNLARLAYSEALIQNADAETELAGSREELESAIGFSSSAISALPNLPEALPEIMSDNKSVEELITNLPEMRMLQSQKEASKAAISRARRDRIPDPTIRIAGGKDEGSNVVGLSVSIPLNIFNTYGNEVDVAKYRTTAQEKSLQSAFHSAKSRLSSSKRSYELASRAWNTWQENGANALAEQINILSRKYKVGDLSATNYLVQVQQTLNTEIAAKELHSKAWKAWFAWIKASGNIEQWLGE
tara:strand:- start:1461 stop:2777 length:1317 start_codon:yes stop_codon:yes gene_type:complete